MTGSVDGHVRAYDLRMGQLRTDFIGGELLSFHRLIVKDIVDATGSASNFRSAHSRRSNLSGDHT